MAVKLRASLKRSAGPALKNMCLVEHSVSMASMRNQEKSAVHFAGLVPH